MGSVAGCRAGRAAGPEKMRSEPGLAGGKRISPVPMPKRRTSPGWPRVCRKGVVMGAPRARGRGAQGRDRGCATQGLIAFGRTCNSSQHLGPSRNMI